MTIGVIFDSDGVVVDSEHYSLHSFKAAIAEQGLDLTDDDLCDCCGLTDEAIITRLTNRYSTPIDLGIFKERKFKLYFELIDRDGLHVFPGVVRLLDRLVNHGIPYALASSGPVKKIDFNLEHVGLRDRFPLIISGEQVKNSKPDPEIFLRAAAMIERNPAECVVIEDSPNGLLGARRAGMQRIGVKTTFQDENILHDADIVVDSVEDITIDLLKSLVESRHDKPEG